MRTLALKPRGVRSTAAATVQLELSYEGMVRSSHRGALVTIYKIAGADEASLEGLMMQLYAHLKCPTVNAEAGAITQKKIFAT